MIVQLIAGFPFFWRIDSHTTKKKPDQFLCRLLCPTGMEFICQLATRVCIPSSIDTELTLLVINHSIVISLVEIIAILHSTLSLKVMIIICRSNVIIKW